MHFGGSLTILPEKYDKVVPQGGRVVPMGTIIARKRKDKSTGYTAQIVIKKDGRIVHREAKTFDRRPAAAAWMEKREKDLRAGVPAGEDPTLAKVIEKYTQDSKREVGRTKAQVLRAIKGYDIGAMKGSEIGSSHIVAFATELAETVQPQTVANYLSHLSAVFAVARPAWGYPLDQQAMADAMTVCKRLGLTSKSTKRDRRPTLDEVDKLMEHFVARNERGRDVVPMERVIAFALFSTRRLGEIVRITWADYDKDGKRVLVRDMKHPGQKRGNDVWVDLPDYAVAIADAMPRTDARIFPYGDDAIGASFTRACALLGIEDLHFHDLRHEGVSRLFEMGWNIPHVAAVSGHRGWQSLQRYTHLRQAGDRWANWKWLAHVSAKIGE